MSLTKSQFERWTRSYRRFAMASCVRLALLALVPIAAIAGTSKGSMLANFSTATLGALIASLFFICAVYFVFEGLTVFYRRIQTTKIGALAGLSAGILCGSLSAFIGVSGCWALWQ
jgi:hypothetical protein